jgi:UDP-2,4-diacetamido-2,4,6-trideoxy-beta-L-altropyranose hydrolase
VLFRADADDRNGSGHVMRCMALAVRLRSAGYAVHLASGELPESLEYWLDKNGLAHSTLADTCDAHSIRELVESLEDVQLLVVDHYGLDAVWETAIRPSVGRVWVIDDLADRHHACDVLIDPGLHDVPGSRYDGLVPTDAVQLLGPTYAFLRPEFDDIASPIPREGEVRELLIYLGGGEGIASEIATVLSAVESMKGDIPLTTVLLGSMSNGTALRDHLAAAHPWAVVLETTDSMAELMSRADLAIGTCGTANWERCSVGLPALTVLTAENQRDDAMYLHEFGAIMHLGDAVDVSKSEWVEALKWAVTHAAALRGMSERARLLVPGWAAAWPAIKELLPHAG